MRNHSPVPLARMSLAPPFRCWAVLSSEREMVHLRQREIMMLPNMVQHVEERSGEYFVRDTRVTIHSAIAARKRGATPEAVVEQFPTISLSDVYNVISFYLDHQEILDAHFAETQAQYERDRAADHAARPEFYAEMRRRVSGH